ncbi:hypothetical protein ABPG75_007145 [Micractinium tetrahymenae]
MQVAEPSKAVPASWGGLLGVCAARTQLSASVPAVLAAVLLAALVVALLVHRRRCRRRQGTASAESATSSPPTIAKLEEQRSMDPLEELPPTPEPRELVIAPATQPSPTVGSLAVREAQQQAPPQPSPSVGSLAVGEAQQQAPPQPASAPPAAVGPGLPDGTHQVRFADGSAYYGEWRGGSMHGRGVFLWPGGARYEGEWQDGREEGTGTFFAPGRGTYYGSWQGGQMHGKCVLSAALPGQVVFLQRYDCGQLVSEQVLRVAHKDVRKKQQKKEGKKQEAKQLQAYHTPKPGEAVYKGHWSYILMRQLQLGLTFCIAQAGLAATAVVDLQEEDFHQETTQHFPIGAETPPFKWKDYAPRVFQQLREEFGIDNSDYLLSLTGEAALRLLGSPGKSGSVFFLSDDDRFLVKTVRKEEMRLLLELIPRYFRHVRANPCTLLVRFYGVHRISPLLGRRVRFIVMGNVLPSDLRMHRRYDLKGSTHGRTAGPQERGANPFATLKDLDVDMQLVLPAKQHGAVLRQLRRDLELLERLHVIDYSLLLGVHFLRWGNAAWHPPFADWPLQPAAVAEAAAGGSAQGSIHGSVEGSPPGPLVQQAQQALLPVQQAPLASVEQVEPAAELQAGQEQQDGFAAAAASLMQTANLSRAQARLSAAGAAQAQHEQRQQLHAEQADQEQCIVLDSRAASGSLLGSSFDSRPASCLGAAASQWPAATAAACAALRQQQEHLGRLLSLRGSGEERESLGRAVPAVAVRRSSGGQLQCEPVLLYFGVIDFLQDYTLRKHLERWTKAAVWGGQAVSVAAPGSYSYRFLAAMQRVLVSSEAAEAGLGCSECGGGGSSKGAG